MIVFGALLEGAARQVPKEVAEWVLERNQKYPNVTFLVERFLTHPTEQVKHEPLMRMYRRSYVGLGTKIGVSQVLFFYLTEQWGVRMIGSLEPEIRDAIVDHSDVTLLDEYSPGIFLERRGGMDEATDCPVEMVGLDPDDQVTSELVITADALREADAQFRVASYNDPTTATDEPLMKQLVNAKDPFEVSVLAYKTRVMAELLSRGIFPNEKDGGRVALGELAPFGDTRVRLDGIAELSDNSIIIVRALASGERMAKGELSFWESVIANSSCKEIIFAHASAMHPLDKTFIKFIAKGSIKVRELQIDEVG